MATLNKLLFNFILLSLASTASFANDSTRNTKIAAPEIIDSKIIEAETIEAGAHGEEAHKNHCYKCHTDDIYTRDNRFVKSIDALSKQVVRCKEGSDIPWFDEDADAVVQFLNKKYYRF